MKTKALKPNVKFTVVNDENGIVYKAVHNKNGKVLFETKCPATIGMLIVDYWIYCTKRKGMTSVKADDLLMEGNKFLSMDITKSLDYFDMWDLLTVFDDLKVSNKLHNGIRYTTEPRSPETLMLYEEPEITQFVNNFYRCKTMGDIVNRIFKFFELNVCEFVNN